MPDTVNARWVAGFEAELPDGTRLIPGQTVVAISVGEATESNFWQPETGEPVSRSELLDQASDLGLTLPGNASKATVEAAIAAEQNCQDRLAAARALGITSDDLADDASIDQIEAAIAALEGDA